MSGWIKTEIQKKELIDQGYPPVFELGVGLTTAKKAEIIMIFNKNLLENDTAAFAFPVSEMEKFAENLDWAIKRAKQLEAESEKADLN